MYETTEGTEQWRVIGGAVVLAVIIAAALWYFLVFREPEQPDLAMNPVTWPEPTAAFNEPQFASPSPFVPPATPDQFVPIPNEGGQAAGGSQGATGGARDVAPSTPTGSNLVLPAAALTVPVLTWLGWRRRKK